MRRRTGPSPRAAARSLGPRGAVRFPPRLSAPACAPGCGLRALGCCSAALRGRQPALRPAVTEPHCAYTSGRSAAWSRDADGRVVLERTLAWGAGRRGPRSLAGRGFSTMDRAPAWAAAVSPPFPPAPFSPSLPVSEKQTGETRAVESGGSGDQPPSLRDRGEATWLPRAHH